MLFSFSVRAKRAERRIENRAPHGNVPRRSSKGGYRSRLSLLPYEAGCKTRTAATKGFRPTGNSPSRRHLTLAPLLFNISDAFTAANHFAEDVHHVYIILL